MIPSACSSPNSVLLDPEIKHEVSVCATSSPMKREAEAQASQWLDNGSCCEGERHEDDSIVPELSLSEVSMREGARSPRSTLLPDEPTVMVARKQQRRKKQVSWGQVRVRRHAIIPGEHPDATNGGPPVSHQHLATLSYASQVVLVPPNNRH